MHEVLVNRLGGLSLPRKSVVRLTDRPDMTLDVYRGRNNNNTTATTLSVYPRVGISLYASETDDRFYLSSSIPKNTWILLRFIHVIRPNVPTDLSLFLD